MDHGTQESHTSVAEPRTHTRSMTCVLHDQNFASHHDFIETAIESQSILAITNSANFGNSPGLHYLPCLRNPPPGHLRPCWSTLVIASTGSSSVCRST